MVLPVFYWRHAVQIASNPAVVVPADAIFQSLDELLDGLEAPPVEELAQRIVVNSKTGKVTLKKGLKAGRYTVRVKLTAPTNKNYRAAKSKTITLKVVIRA